MAAEKDNKVLSLRPKEGSTLRSDLMGLANEKKWSLNQYAIEVLEEHVKKAKPKIKTNGKN